MSLGRSQTHVTRLFQTAWIEEGGEGGEDDDDDDDDKD